MTDRFVAESKHSRRGNALPFPSNVFLVSFVRTFRRRRRRSNGLDPRAISFAIDDTTVTAANDDRNDWTETNVDRSLGFERNYWCDFSRLNFDDDRRTATNDLVDFVSKVDRVAKGTNDLDWTTTEARRLETTARRCPAALLPPSVFRVRARAHVRTDLFVLFPCCAFSCLRL